MRLRIVTLVLGAVTAGVALTHPAAVEAHHAFSAEFDASKPVLLKGMVTGVEWVNPHVWIHVDVQTASGKTEPWAIEAGTPNVLFRRGITKHSLKAGTAVTVDGYQAKDGSRRANGREVRLADGSKLFLGSSGTGAPYEIK